MSPKVSGCCSQSKTASPGCCADAPQCHGAARWCPTRARSRPLCSPASATAPSPSPRARNTRRWACARPPSPGAWRSCSQLIHGHSRHQPFFLERLVPLPAADAGAHGARLSLQGGRRGELRPTRALFCRHWRRFRGRLSPPSATKMVVVGSMAVARVTNHLARRAPSLHLLPSRS